MSLLSVKNVGKAYKTYSSEWKRFARWFGLPLKPSEEHWVLRHINFDIHPGEAIGIVGQNGAGKSTLLKIITGTLQPTEGQVHVNGRIAAILELGMGFNPELTGRQNVLHSAGLMGFSSEEIQKAMPDIEAFAEIGDYFDEPVRAYSSGMQMRVAFAVATAYRPEILVVDEALSVGDTYFQHKCMTRIREFREQGTTLLLVSHDVGTIKNLCDKALLLDQGGVLKEGHADEIADYYNALIAEKENSKLSIQQRREKNGWLITSSGTNEASITSIRLLDTTTNQEISVAKVGQCLELKLEVKINMDIPKLVLGLMIRDLLGSAVWGTNTWYTHQQQCNLIGAESLSFSLKFPCNLGPGSYSFSTALCSTDTHLEDNFEWVENHLVFEVVNLEKTLFVGTNWLDAQINVDRNSSTLQDIKELG